MVHSSRPPDICACRISRRSTGWWWWRWRRGRCIRRAHPRCRSWIRVRCHCRRKHLHPPRCGSWRMIRSGESPTRGSIGKWLLKRSVCRRRWMLRGPCLWGRRNCGRWNPCSGSYVWIACHISGHASRWASKRSIDVRKGDRRWVVRAWCFGWRWHDGRVMQTWC